MTIKQLVPRMLFVLGLVSLLLVLPVELPADCQEYTGGDGQQGTYSSGVTCYDDNGRRISQSFITDGTMVNGKLVSYNSTLTTFDPVSGRPTHKTVHTKDGILISTSYDQNGNVTSTTTYDPKGGVGYGSTETCDAKGKCTKIIEAIDPSTRKRLGQELQVKPQPPATTKPTDKPPLAPTAGADQLMDVEGEIIGTRTATTGPFGSSETFTYTAGPKAGTIETTTRDADGKDVITITDKNGKVVSTTTVTTDGEGAYVRTTTDAKTGNVTTKKDDGSATVTDKNGKLLSTTTITSSDREGNSTSLTKDKNGKVLSTTATTPDGNGGLTSVTKDRNGKIVSSIVNDKLGNVVSQTGKTKIMSLGASGQSTGGTQTSQGSGKQKEKHKVETEVFQNKEKSNFQNLGLSPASSGPSGQSHHHGKR